MFRGVPRWIQDQRAAMVWTQKNIASFGGDPGKVYIVGQSAGANSVSQHLVRPKSWGLFSSAGMESGAFNSTPMGDQSGFVWLSARTPHGAYVW